MVETPGATMMRSILLLVSPLLLASALASCVIDTYLYRSFAGAVRDGVVRFDSVDVTRGSTEWFWMLYRDSLTRCSTTFNLGIPSDERSSVKFSVHNRLHADVTLTDVWARFEWKDEEGRLRRLDTFESRYYELMAGYLVRREVDSLNGLEYGKGRVDSIRYPKDRVWHLDFPGGIQMSVEEIFLECRFTIHLGNEQRVVHERLVIVTKTGRSVRPFGIRHCQAVLNAEKPDPSFPYLS